MTTAAAPAKNRTASGKQSGSSKNPATVQPKAAKVTPPVAAPGDDSRVSTGA